MKLKTLLLILAIALSGATMFGQSKASELRKKRMQEEQSSEVFAADDEDFNITEIPEKWADESAVVLCQSHTHKYLRNRSTKAIHEQAFRRRIKLNDNAAIDNFDIFYYRYSSLYEESFGIKIIKPDGTEHIVDLEESVEVASNEVPSYFRRSYLERYESSLGRFSFETYKKIAIPNLELGDIIDYYYTSEDFAIVQTAYSYSPLVFTLAGKYPIVKQKFHIAADDLYFISFRNFNGAPEAKPGKPELDKKGRVIPDIRTYTIEDTDREKLHYEYWKYQYLNEPYVKFQANLILKGLIPTTHLLIEDDHLVNDTLDLDNIQNRNTRRKGLITEHVDAIGYMNRYHKNMKNPEKVATEIYYFLRYKFYQNLFFNITSSYQSSYLKADELPIKNHYFTYSFIDLLTKLKIKCKYVIAVDKRYGGFGDVLLADELISGVKVGDRYFFNFTNFTTDEYIPHSVRGSEAIEFRYDKNNKYDKIPITRTTIPAGSYEDNSIEHDITATIADDFSNIKFKSHNTCKGYFKTYYAGIALYSVEYFEQEKKKYDPKYKGPDKPRGNKARIKEINRQKKEEEKERLQKKYEYLKQHHEDDYEIESYDDFKLISDGRSRNAKDLIYDEEFTVNNLLRKAGKNYVIDLGKFIGDQFALEQEDMERRADIHLDYAKCYINKINLKIPVGYKVEGLDAFNVSVVNEKGEFTSVAKIEEGVLKLEVHKKYKVQNALATDWPLFIDFLEEAYNFSQKKAVLKPI